RRAGQDPPCAALQARPHPRRPGRRLAHPGAERALRDVGARIRSAMNKTLLLILCDFLLLNLLALTRWEKAAPPRPKQPPVPELAANAVTKDQDLVETMRQSLADEKSVRDELAQKMSATEASLAAREQSLSQVQA